MNNEADSPRQLGRQWLALLLAPVAWSAALGILFVLTEDACARETRASLWVVIVICIALAVLSAPLAWRTRDAAGEDGGPDRVRFLMGAALGLSAIFSAVLILMAVPILMLDACRT